MSFNGHSSTETLVVDVLEPLKLQLQPFPDVVVIQEALTRDGASPKAAVPSFQQCSKFPRSSEDTLAQAVHRKKPKKEKKAPKAVTQPPKETKEKLSEQIAGTFAEQLSRGAQFTNSSDVIRCFLTPQSAMLSQQATTITPNTMSAKGPTTRTDPKPESPTGQNYQASYNSKMRAKYRMPGHVFCLDEISTYTYVEKLVERFGKVSHMGVLDETYSIFLNLARDGALLFKIYDKVAVVSGDPLCEWHRLDDLLLEFAAYRKQLSLDISFLGATTEFGKYAEGRKWVTMQFGVEKVLNPMTNPLLLESGAGKRTISSSMALIKKGVSLGIYIPKYGSDEILQDQIMDVYNAWCSDRNGKPIIQAYVSVLDPLAMPGLMTYICAKDKDGSMLGFIALRKIVKGYHIDPCVARPGSPRGTTELLIIAAMSLLHSAGVEYLSLGFDPAPELGDITGVPKVALRATRSIHKHSFESLPIGGKQAFYDKFHPDGHQQNDMFIIIPTRGLPKIRHMTAMMHNANIDISSILRQNFRRSLGSTIENTKSKSKVEVTSEQTRVALETSEHDLEQTN